jgi:opacity protein-like surface antigen
MKCTLVVAAASLSTLLAGTAHAQGFYPYTQSSYAPAYAAAPPGYVLAKPSSFDPMAGRSVRLYFGASGLGTFVVKQTGGAEQLTGGAGFNLHLGVDIGRFVGVQATYLASYSNPDGGCDPVFGWCQPSMLTLQMISADLRLHIPTGTPFRPYLQAGAGVAWIGRPHLIADAVGAGFDAGLGFDYFLGHFVTLGVSGLYRGIEMMDYGFITGSNSFLSLITVEASLALHF